MSQDREKLKRRREKRPGRKRPKRGPSWKYIVRASVLIVIFAVALIVFVKLLSLVPGSSALSPLVTLGLPLVLAWLVAAGTGQNFVPTKQSLALATICLLVAAPLAYYKPWERGWQPGGGQAPENVPEGYVAFRFVSSFTYVSSEGDQPITDVELELPWPYIDDYENGRPAAYPVGLDNWLRKTDLSITLPEDNAFRQWLWEVWKLEGVPSLGEIENRPELENWYELENAVWAVNLVLPGLPYKQVLFDPSLKLYYGDQLQWQDNQPIALLGGRTTAPIITGYIESRASQQIFPKITVHLSNMRPGETVAIEGTFLVAEENASKVRLDDWIECGLERTFDPQLENAPVVSWNFSPNIQIGERFLSVLKKQVDANWVDVVNQQFGRITTVGYVTPPGFGPLTTLA